MKLFAKNAKKRRICAPRSVPLTTWIDLTRRLGEGIPVYPGDPLFQARPFAEHATDGFRGTCWSFGSHIGTHFDAPFHYFIDGETLDSFPLDFFFDDAAVLDLTSALDLASPRRVGRPPTISPDDLVPFESVFETVPFVFLRTGWAARFGCSDYYNAFPSLTLETADWLADFPKLRILGLETPSLVAFPPPPFDVESDEFVRNLDSPLDDSNAAKNVLNVAKKKVAVGKTRRFESEFLPENVALSDDASPFVASSDDAPLDELELCADAECHRVLLGRRPPILILEGLVGLERLPAFALPTDASKNERISFDWSRTFVVSAFPLSIERSDGCPVRVAARLGAPRLKVI